MEFMPKKHEPKFKARLVRITIQQIPHYPPKTTAL
jgi:hypothetical protein